jgi:Zn-dependent M16 (insulinase) family peptidase
MYGTDPAALLDIDPILEQLQKRIGDPDYIKRLIRRRLLDNLHRVRVTMVPDTTKLDKDSEAERGRLASLHAELTRDRIARLQEDANALKARQAQEDDPDVLPKVTLADVPPGVVKTAGRIDRLDNTAVHCYERGTNGLSHLQLVIDLPRLSDEELSHLPLFCEYITELGMGDQTYLEVQTGRARVGVFGAYATIRADIDDAADMRGHFVITAKGLERKNDSIVDTLLEILPRVRFDERDRLRELLAQSRSEAELSITERGHHLAIIGAARGLSAGGWLDDVWEGPASIRALKTWEKQARNSDHAAARIQSVFSTIRDKLLASPYRLLTVAEQRSIAEIQAALMRSRHQLRGAGGGRGFMVGPPGPGEHAAWITNTQVNFCAKAYPVVHEGHPDAATLMVLDRYIQDGFLHPAIREVGGAYGSGASYDADSSTFRLFSYRDPRLEETLVDFDRSLEWLRETRDPRRLEEAILGVIRSLDQPRSPAGEAVRAFYHGLQGRSDEFRQLFRERVLKTGLDDLVTVAGRYLALNPGTVGIVTSSVHGRELERLGIELIEL